MLKECLVQVLYFLRAKKALAKGRSPPQELEVGPRSGPYLLVNFQLSDSRVTLYYAYVVCSFLMYCVVS